MLVEAHDAAEVERALALEARIVGVNARNLSTFDEHLDLVAELSAQIPSEVIAVAESAIRSAGGRAPDGAVAGFDAVLVGEALVRAPDAAALVAALGDVKVNERGGTHVIRFDLSHRSDPDRLVQRAAGPARADAAAAAPGHQGADRSRTTSTPLFPMGLIAQEVSTEAWIDIPGEVLDILRLWRPTPLVRATRLEEYLGTPARIYFKDESVSPAGSHKPNTAVPQAFYNKAEGITRLTTETGAGQWGTALSFACRQFDVDCKVYMVRSSYEQKPYRKIVMETWGGEVRPVADRRPVESRVRSGSRSPTRCATRPGARTATTRSARCSTTSCCTRRSSGSRRKEQLALAGEARPDVVIASCGGGSNLGGIALPFMTDSEVRLVAVEPASCPTLTEGRRSSTTSATRRA